MSMVATADGIVWTLVSRLAACYTFTDTVERRTAMTVWAALAAIGGTFGVVMGGALITWASWPWAFWINLPIGLIAAAMMILFVPQLSEGPKSRARFDMLGGLLSVGGLATLIFGLISVSDHGWASPRTAVGIPVGLLLLAWFGLAQGRRTVPLLPTHLLTRGPLLLSSIGLLLVAALMMSVFFMVSVYQQQVLGYTAFQAGLGVATLGLATLLIFPVIPRLMTRIGAPRLYLVGSVLVLAGVALLGFLPTPTSSFVRGLLPGLVVLGFGIPCCFATLNAMGVSAVQPAESGAASGVLTTFNQTGAALGMATVITLATAVSGKHVDSGQALPQALSDGFRAGYFALAGVAVAKVVLATVLTVKEGPVRRVRIHTTTSDAPLEG